MTGSSDIAIEITNVSKIYGLPYGDALANKYRALLGKPALAGKPQALRNINIKVKRGEILGLIGRNGAGKSTLLKMIAGVSPPTTGSVKVSGSVFPMIELNAGMNTSLTGRENVILLATILGLSPEQIKQRMPEIEEFCNLGEWFDKPVKQYSSGMPGRLGFAVAVYSDADILLIDEVLAVGDITFRDKCMEKMEALRETGKTVVFASHNLSAVAGLCTRTIMIDLGEVRYDSVPSATVQHYKNFVSSISKKKISRKVTGLETIAASGFTLHGVVLINSSGQMVTEINGKFPCGIVADCDIPLEFDEGIFELIITSSDGVTCIHDDIPVRIEGGPVYRRITVSFAEGLRLHPGEYMLSLRLIDGRNQETVISAQMPLRININVPGKGIYIPVANPEVSSPTINPVQIPLLKSAS